MSAAAKRRALPEVEEGIPLGRGVGPAATTVVTPAPDVAAEHQPDGPSESAAIEVAPEVVVPAPRLEAAPEFTEASGAPDRRLAHYERTIQDARDAIARAEKMASRYWIRTAGRALTHIRDEKLWELYDHKSFEEYVNARWEIGRQHAYKLMNAVWAELALPDVDEAWTVRQITIFAQVGRAHEDQQDGIQAIQELWAKAVALGDTSAKGLEAAQEVLELPSTSELEQEGDKPKQGRVVLPTFQRAVRPFEDLRKLRRLAIEYPEYAENVVRVLEEAVRELKGDLASRD